VLTERYWREVVVPADPKVWAWMGRRLPDRALLAAYRATFFYGLCRLIAWTSWAHLLHPDRLRGWDLTWGGPDWIPAFSLTHTSAWGAAGVAVVFAVAIVAAVSRILGKEPDPANLLRDSAA
jgi:hypothetical protein